MQSRQKKFRRSFLVQKGENFIPVSATDFAFFFIRNGVVKGVIKDDLMFHLDEKLEDLEKDLDPDLFFRANRQFIVQRSSIESLQSYFGGRLIVKVQPKAGEQIIVSKANAANFKAWLNDTKW